MESRPLKWFAFYGNLLLLKQSGQALQVPMGTEPPTTMPHAGHMHRVYMDSGEEVMAYALEEEVKDSSTFVMKDLRSCYYVLSEADYLAAGKASQILYWDSHSRFCPVCGTPTVHREPIMKKCPHCGYEMFPAVSTAIIVLIRKGSQILLVQSRNFKKDYYGLVAGFLEAGESLEECVQREVREETGLRIKNLQYFDSQPWPYPSGLMAGFTADYDGGELTLQDEELKAGGFFGADNLPAIPGKMSMARRLIDRWLEEQKQ